jgi:two-component system NtrC family response regulator/two-component system response regulator AtoC
MATESPSRADAGKVLLVDDDRSLVGVLSRELERIGFQVASAATAEAAAALAAKEDFDVILLDLRLGGADGLDVFKRIREAGVTSEVIIYTGHGTIDTAIEAMRRGAREYLIKPCKLAELETHLRKAVESRRLRDENAQLKDYLSRSSRTPEIITSDPAMLRLLEAIPRVARSDVPVLIQGESGTGKELVAHQLHALSESRGHAFIPVNCAVLKAEILESELFGHEKGAFTGAVRRKLGLFEIASGGTIFLDEIGEIEESTQAKLLRVLQFGEFRRVGGTENLHVKTRVIAATNRNLESAAASGKFRQDLFYRLNVVTLEVPPLREHTEDIERLFQHFWALYGGPQPLSLLPEALDLLKRYSWPGNVRELENVVRRVLIFGDRVVVNADAIRSVLPRLQEHENESLLSLEEIERRHILRVLAEQGNDKKKTSEILKISLKTLYNKLHLYNWPFAEG